MSIGWSSKCSTFSRAENHEMLNIFPTIPGSLDGGGSDYN